MLPLNRTWCTRVFSFSPQFDNQYLRKHFQTNTYLKFIPIKVYLQKWSVRKITKTWFAWMDNQVVTGTPSWSYFLWFLPCDWHTRWWWGCCGITSNWRMSPGNLDVGITFVAYEASWDSGTHSSGRLQQKKYE